MGSYFAGTVAQGASVIGGYTVGAGVFCGDEHAARNDTVRTNPINNFRIFIGDSILVFGVRLQIYGLTITGTITGATGAVVVLVY